jgi:glycosyltransferase involved in cell wall biosynthesis
MGASSRWTGSPVSEPSSRPRVSIGVPVYNGERYLAATLDSLLAQTFGDFEIILCDNASTDGTEDIARAYATRDRRIRYVRSDRNLGAARNYNRAFELSTGEYFRWFAGDDVAAPRSLERCVAVLDREPAVVLVYPKTKLIDEQGRVIGDYDDRLHLQSPNPCDRFAQLLSRLGLCNAMYGLMRTATVKRTGLLGAYIGSDEMFQAELVLYGTFWEIPEFLFFRRMHAAASSSMTRQQKTEFYRPERTRAVEMTNWRHLRALSRAVRRSPLSLGDKLRLHAYLARTVVWSRQALGHEISLAMRQVLAGLFRSSSA